MRKKTHPPDNMTNLNAMGLFFIEFSYDLLSFFEFRIVSGTMKFSFPLISSMVCFTINFDMDPDFWYRFDKISFHDQSHLIR